MSIILKYMQKFSPYPTLYKFDSPFTSREELIKGIRLCNDTLNSSFHLEMSKRPATERYYCDTEIFVNRLNIVDFVTDDILYYVQSILNPNFCLAVCDLDSEDTNG